MTAEEKKSVLMIVCYRKQRLNGYLIGFERGPSN